MATIRIVTKVALLAFVLGGCSSTPRVEEHFGEAVRANLAAQVANPKAAPNTNPAAGVDGAAAKGAQDRYERSFTQPEKQETSLIATIGGK